MELISRVFSGLASRFRRLFYCRLGVVFEGRCRLSCIEIPRQHNAIHIGDDVALDSHIVLLASGSPRSQYKIKIGAKTYINRFTFIDAVEQIEIGDNCMIGPFVYVTDHDHTFGADGRPGSGNYASAPTRISNRCWIGAHVTILKGVTIGEGVIVGAGAVVTKSVAANTIVAGNPARVIKERS